MSRIHGGCLCGQVRYSAEGDPIATLNCHCPDCQKQTGTAFSVIIGVRDDALKISGTLKTYDTTGESGRSVHRKFCPECGSPVLTEVDAIPGASWIKAGTLDDTSWLRPAMDIWCSTAQGWLPMLEATQKFDKGPG